HRQSGRGLRRVWRLDLLWGHGGGAVRVSGPRPAGGRDAPGRGVSRAGISLHAGVIRRGGGTGGGELHRRQSEERRDRDRALALGNTGFFVLEGQTFPVAPPLQTYSLTRVLPAAMLAVP